MGSTIYLHIELGTMYVANFLIYDLRGVLEKAVNTSSVLDVCNCKFGPSCARELFDYYGKLVIIDSRDEDRNRFFKENRDAVEFNKNIEEYLTINFSQIYKGADAQKLIAGLKSGSKYEPIGVSEVKPLAALCLAIMLRPDVEFDIHSCTISIYNLISTEWQLKAGSHKKYIEFMMPDFRIVECVDGFVTTPEYGRVSESIYISKAKALPYEFGSEVVVEVDDAGKPIGEWAGVVAKLLRILNGSKKSKKSIMELLEYVF